MDRQLQAYGYALATVACWATVASAFKLSLRFLSPLELLLYSSLTSFIALAAILAFSGKLGDYRSWPARAILRSAVLGFLNPFLYYLILFKAYALLPAQEAQPLNFIWPIVLVVLSVVLLGQRLTWLKFAALLISFVGAIVIATRGDVLGLRISNGFGVGLALGSALVWALYWLYGVKDERDPVARLTLNFAFGFIFVALYTLLFVGWRPPSALVGLAGAAYVGLFEMGIAFVLWLRALQLSRTTAQVSNLIYLTPFLSLTVIHFVLGEPIDTSTLVGLVLIVGGILLQQYGEALLTLCGLGVRTNPSGK